MTNDAVQGILLVIVIDRLTSLDLMATTAGTSSPSSPLPSTASTLWAHLLHRYSDPSKANAAAAAQPSSSYAQLTPQDKVGTSTRILLHDTHARLEKFSERANAIFSELEASRREMVRVREQVENAREKEFEEIAQLSAFHFYFCTHICCLSHAHPGLYIYTSQPMPVFAPKGDRRAYASAPGYRDASTSYVNLGAIACTRGQAQ
jgi:hypothetical protein